MDSIKLLIADDEDNIRNAISKMIKWESENIKVCALAKNGKEAYEKIMEYGADVALLDIRMPLMTGIQVAEQLKINDIPTKVIILSGYDDFNYAKEALIHGAMNYLLKPCRPDEILKAVKEAKEQIVKERLLKKEKENLTKEVEENRFEIKNKWMSDLILTTNEVMLSKICERFQFTLRKNVFCLVIQPPENVLFFVNQQQKLIHYLESELDCVAGCVAETIVAAVNVKDEVGKREFRERLMGMKRMSEKVLSLPISIGVGNLVSNKEGLNRSYQNARKALEMIHFLGTDFIIFYDSIYASPSQEYPFQVENQILEAIKQQNRTECRERMDEFITVSSRGDDVRGLLKNAIAFMLSIYHFSLSNGVETELIFGRPIELMEQIQKCRTKTEISDQLKKQCELVIEKLEDNITENRFVNAAILYVKQNYSKDITLSMVANEIFITSGYLSTLFKQVKGESFVNYLNQVRIDHACKLLKDVRLRTYEVAHKVGFQDEKYFTKVFKKIVGVSPSLYRKE